MHNIVFAWEALSRRQTTVEGSESETKIGPYAKTVDADGSRAMEDTEHQPGARPLSNAPKLGKGSSHAFS